jgi:hypothetical protein
VTLPDRMGPTKLDSLAGLNENRAWHGLLRLCSDAAACST